MTVTVAVTVVCGILCQGVARLWRMPAIVPLLLVGMALGPSALGILHPEGLGQGLRVLVGLAVAIILFEGGLSLKTEAFRFAGKAIRNLVVIGSLVTWGFAALAAWILFPELGAAVALLFGSLVIVTGPTVIGPILGAIHPRARIAHVLRGEAILADPVGALYAVLVLEWVVASGSEQSMGVLGSFGLRLGAGVFIGCAGALFLNLAMRRSRILDPELRNLAVLATALGIYALSEYLLPESGVLTVTVAGFLLGWLHPPGIEEVEEFKGHITVLMVSIVFILLAASVSIDSMLTLGWRGFALVGLLILVGRPLTIFVSTLGTDLSRRERLFLSWIAPRGIVAAAVASLFALVMENKGIRGGPQLMTMVFAVILGTVVIQGPTAGWVARLLGVLQGPRTGFLLLGGSAASRTLALAIQKTGRPVLVVDTNAARIELAQEAGLPARRVNALDEVAMANVALDDIGTLLAITGNDSVNRLAVRLFARDFGSDHVRAICSRMSPAFGETSEGVPYLFGRRLVSADLERRIAAGATIESAVVDDEIKSHEIDRLAPGAIALMTLGDKGKVGFIADDGPLPVGETLIYLARPETDPPTS